MLLCVLPIGIHTKVEWKINTKECQFFSVLIQVIYVLDRSNLLKKRKNGCYAIFVPAFLIQNLLV